MGVYFFFGKEEYNIEQEIEEFKKKYLDEAFSSLNLRHFNSPNFDELANILRTTGTMFGNIINIVDTYKYFYPPRNQKILSDEDLDLIAEDLKLTSDNVHTIFVLKIPRDEKNSVTSKKIYKILTKNTQKKEFAEFKNYDKELFNWIIKNAKSKDLIISTDCAQYLVEKAGVNLRLLNSHIDKLQLTIYPNKTITKDIIDKNLFVTENAFKVADYIVTNKKDLAVLEFNRLCQKKHPLEVLALLQSTFSQWIEMKMDIESMSLAEIAQKQRKHEYVIKLTLQKISNISLKELVNIKKNLLKAEEALKINYSLAEELEIEKAILSDF